jgi:predicted amidophosphoribosyltransferase
MPLVNPILICADCGRSFPNEEAEYCEVCEKQLCPWCQRDGTRWDGNDWTPLTYCAEHDPECPSPKRDDGDS